MIKLFTVIGARPQIIKAAAISRIIRDEYPGRMKEVILHTGQHYDTNMSEVFFQQMGIPQPDFNLNVGSLPHGEQTARMIEGIEKLLVKEHPDFVVIYGDTNSTLAAAITASKLHIPVAHVEAGLRSFNKSMPEEINRILSDHVSTLLFTPTLTGVQNLVREGFRLDNAMPYSPDNPQVYHCGDVMYDNMLYYSKIAENHSPILRDLHLESDQYILSTIHRDHNTDNPDRLQQIFKGILNIVEITGLKVVLPLHPRTQKLMPIHLPESIIEEIRGNDAILIIPPASFFDMILLEKYCRMVMTDSGGVQKEAWFNKKPCVILRPETEWKEIVEHGAGILVDANEQKITEAIQHYMHMKNLEYPPIFGDGFSASFICEKIFESCSNYQK